MARNFKKSNGRKPRKKENDGKDENNDSYKFSRRKGSNDPAWYAADPALLRDAASIPFSWATGTNFNLGQPIGAKTNEPQYVVPGVNVLYLVPSVSHSTYPSDPINVAASSMYAYVRKANSGSANYDSPDLMLYVMAMSNVYSYINFLQRTYGLATLYSQRNRYTPNALLRASFVDPDDVHQHLADFRYGINVLINKAASFAVPATMSLFYREAMIYKTIYTEGTSMKDQLYMYSPAAFWQYQLIEDSGALVVNPFATTVPAQSSGQLPSFADTSTFKYYTVSELIDYGATMLAPILQSEDFNIMSGDILKAYGDNIIKLSSLPTEYPILPEFNIGVLEQMKNATILPNIAAYTGLVFNLPSITQDATKGWLISNPSIVIPDVKVNSPAAGTTINEAMDALMSYTSEGRLLTTTTAEVTPELVIESTRLMTVTQRNWLESKATYTIYSGAEIVVAGLLWHYNYDNNVQTLLHTNYSYIDLSSRAGTTSSTNGILSQYMSKIARHAILENFDFHSQIHEVFALMNSTENTIDVTDNGFAFDIDNYAVLTVQDIFRMHEAALLNMLHVPSIGKLG